MLRANKKGEWEVDWELTGKVALEGNYKLQEKVRELEKEIKDLKEEKENLIRADKKKSEHIDELEKTLEHRDSFFSIMWDVLANNSISNEELAAILFCVVHEECGDFDLSKKELEIVKRFWKRKYC